MNAGTSCWESKGPQTKNQNKSNTSSCAALENLIKSKSTLETPEDSTKKLLDLINELSKAIGYKINVKYK